MVRKFYEKDNNGIMILEKTFKFPVGNDIEVFKEAIKLREEQLNGK